MARRVNKKCIECAQLTAVQAQKLHGKQGDGCWNEKRCPRRRSHYRNRQTLNEQRRLQYQRQVASAVSEEHVETVVLPVAETSAPYANLYIWREKRKDAPVHAMAKPSKGIAASVFQNGSKVLEVAPIHCAGYRKRQLENYVQRKVMPYLNARFGITFFADEIRLEPIECPIAECPWGDHLAKIEVADG
jgi:YesN/AraC family two-component response regulator